MICRLFGRKNVKLAQNRLEWEDRQGDGLSIENSFFFLEKSLKVETQSGENGGEKGGNSGNIVMEEPSFEDRSSLSR